MRLSVYWYSKSVFQADPGASSRAECHHGAIREYEQETCRSYAPLTADLSSSLASITERKGVLQWLFLSCWHLHTSKFFKSGIKENKLLLSALGWRHILLYDLCESVISPAAIGLLASALERTILKLYVGKLPYQTTDQDLADLFGQYGQVISATVIIDRDTGRSKGFGFVEMSNNQEAQAAQNQLNNSVIGDRTIVVNEANDRRDSRSSGYRDRRY